MREKLGPTGRHVNDLLLKKREPPPRPAPPQRPDNRRPQTGAPRHQDDKEAPKPKPKAAEQTVKEKESRDTAKKGLVNKPANAKAKEFRDIKPTTRKVEPQRNFDARDRQGLRTPEETNTWRKRRQKQAPRQQEDTTIRPTALKVRMPIAIKDLAAEMKLKASQLIAKLFMQGVLLTLNDYLDDETTIQLLGHEFGCEISIDTAEKERLQVTDKTIREEICPKSEVDKLVFVLQS